MRAQARQRMQVSGSEGLPVTVQTCQAVTAGPVQLQELSVNVVLLIVAS